MNFISPAKDLVNDALSAYLDEKHISGHSRGQLDALTGDDRAVITKVVAAVRPSAGTLLEIFRLAREISARDRCSLKQVFEASDLNSVIASERPSNKERAKELKRALELRRFPETARIEEKLSACVRQIARDTGLKVELPQDLEGDALSLVCRFSSVEQIMELSKKLEQLAEHPATSEILLTLRGLGE